MKYILSGSLVPISTMLAEWEIPQRVVFMASKISTDIKPFHYNRICK